MDWKELSFWGVKIPKEGWIYDYRPWVGEDTAIQNLLHNVAPINNNNLSTEATISIKNDLIVHIFYFAYFVRIVQLCQIAKTVNLDPR